MSPVPAEGTAHPRGAGAPHGSSEAGRGPVAPAAVPAAERPGEGPGHPSLLSLSALGGCDLVHESSADAGASTAACHKVCHRGASSSPASLRWLPLKEPRVCFRVRRGVPSRWATWADIAPPAPREGVVKTDHSTQLSSLLTPLPFSRCTTAPRERDTSLGVQSETAARPGV